MEFRRVLFRSPRRQDRASGARTPGSNAPGSNAPGSSAAAPGDRQSQRRKGRLTPMATETFSERAAELANQAQHLAEEVASLAVEASRITAESAEQGGGSALVVGLTVFVLAVFVGYHVVWRVTAALHLPIGR